MVIVGVHRRKKSRESESLKPLHAAATSLSVSPVWHEKCTSIICCQQGNHFLLEWSENAVVTQVFYFMALAVSLVWCLPLLSGQKGPRIQPNGDATVRTGSMRSSVATSVGDEKLADYFIGVGDVLTISVWREEQASVDAVAVRSDGKITLPLVKEVEVAGLRPMELEKILNSRFVEFIREPEVTVMVREIHSQKVYVLGGVQSPGSLELRTRMTILQVLAEVGGLTEYAKRKKIYVLRDINAKQTRIPYDYDADLKGTGEQKPVFVKPGDTIVVPD